MFSRYRDLVVLATSLGALVAFVLILSFFAAGGFQRTVRTLELEASDRANPTAPAIGDASQYAQRACERAASRDEADLCQQWRMAEAAKKQLWITGIGSAATVGALVAAILALWASISASRRQLRAYVVVGDARLAFVRSGIASIEILIVNSGQTPAHELRSLNGLGVHPHPGGCPVVTTESFAPGGSRTTLGSGRDRTLSVDHLLTRQHQAQLAAGTHAIYAFGRVEYDDVHGHRHYTNYRLWTRETAGGPFPMKHHLEGNDAD